MQQKRNKSPLNRFIPLRRLNNIIQKIIASFDFVPKEQITLRKFKIINIQMFHKRQSDHIQRSKNPTSTRILLIRNRFPLNLDLMIEHILYLLDTFSHQCNIKRICTTAHILCKYILFIRIERITIGFNCFAL